ncbi:MAG: hypothetical protein IK005_07435 [Paludibacteraceae bacterium]|nr:hypothetical protein [Paludibacteraceae bacterium]
MENNIDALYQYVADMILKKDMTAREVRKVLVGQGVNEEVAKTIVKQVSDEIAKVRKKEASKNLIIGGIICGIGLLVTILSCINSAGTGSYVIAFGAIIGGAVKFVQGISLLSKI